SLRQKQNGTCAALDLTATEVGSVSVEGSTARITASPQIVLTSSTGTTTLSWAATYDLINLDGPRPPLYAPYAGSYAVWVRTDDQVDSAGRPLYSPLACIDDFSNPSQGISSTGTAPWIQAGHKYRFSLNLHNDPENTGVPGTCAGFATCDTFRPGCCANPHT